MWEVYIVRHISMTTGLVLIPLLLSAWELTHCRNSENSKMTKPVRVVSRDTEGYLLFSVSFLFSSMRTNVIEHPTAAIA